MSASIIGRVSDVWIVTPPEPDGLVVRVGGQILRLRVRRLNAQLVREGDLVDATIEAGRCTRLTVNGRVVAL